MAKDKDTNAAWSMGDEALLVAPFLVQKTNGHQSESGWKPCTYTAVVLALAVSKVGQPKQSQQSSLVGRGCIFSFYYI